MYQWRETAVAWVEEILTSADVQAGEARMLAPGLTVPPMDAVLKWGCTTLDTHFITLAGLPAGAQQALKAFQSRIQEMLQVCMLAVLCIIQCPALSSWMEHSRYIGAHNLYTVICQRPERNRVSPHLSACHRLLGCRAGAGA